MNANAGEHNDQYRQLFFMKIDGATVPMPELLTEDEAIKFLRLDVQGPKDPKLTLRYYREQGLLKGTKVGKRIRYQKKELLRFVDRLTYGNSGRSS